MRVVYELENTPQLKDLKFEVENRGSELAFEVQGPNSESFKPMLKMYFDWLNRRGPIGAHNGANVYSLYLPPIPSRPHSRMVEGFLHTFLLRQPTPQAVTIAVTDKCQYKCVHCSAAAYQSARPILSAQEINKIVAESIALGVNNVTFTGGEPLLRDDLESLISSVDKERAVAQVFTNGSALDSKRAASIKAHGAYGVQISLDSPDPDEHDRLRGPKGAFQAVENGVKCALNSGLLVGLSTYATRDSIRQKRLAEIASLGATWGVQEISVFDVIPTGRLLRQDDLILDKESRTALLEQARTLNKQYRGRTRIVTQSWTNSGVGFAKSFGCLAGNYQFHVTAYGDCTPCDFTPLSFGNVREQPIADLWKKLSKHPAYCKHRDECRMQSSDFRNRYILGIPNGGRLPYPIDNVEPQNRTEVNE